MEQKPSKQPKEIKKKVQQPQPKPKQRIKWTLDKSIQVILYVVTFGVMTVGLFWMVAGREETTSTAQSVPTVTATTLSTTPTVEATALITKSDILTPINGINGIAIGELKDVETHFIETYQNNNLSRQKTMDVDYVKVVIRELSSDGQSMLLMVKTGEVLVGFPPNRSPSTKRKRQVRVNDLWLADATGMPLYLLAETAAWHVWSPDNKYIAYTHEKVVDEILTNELWVVQVDGNNAKKLYSGAMKISWLDDNTITFIDLEGQLQLIDKDGQNKRAFIFNGVVSRDPFNLVTYQFSPDRKKIAFEIRGDEMVRVAEVSTEEANLILEFETPDTTNYSWSPNSEYLAYSPICIQGKIVNTAGCQWIEIIDTQGTLIGQIEGYNAMGDIAWSPDNQYILFQAENTLYISDKQGEKIEPLPIPSGEAHHIRWASHGQTITLNRDVISGARILTVETE